MENLKSTPLLKTHEALKARIVDFAGFAMPVQYQSVKEEVEVVRKSAGVFDVSHMGEFWVNGPDAVAFVDYIMTNDFLNAPVGKAVYSPLCNHEGKILDDLIAYKLSNNRVLICVNASNVDKDWSWIKQFSSKFKIELTNASDETSLLAIQGPRSEEVLGQILSLSLTELPYYGVLSAKWDNSEIIIARTGYTGEDGFEVFCPNQSIVKLWNAMMELKVAPCGLAARDVLRLEVCYPLYGNDLSEELTPLDAGLKWTVKLDKADFVGKSALTNYQPVKKLIKFQLEKGIPRSGYLIVDGNGKQVGLTSSGTHSVSLERGIGMALINFSQSTKEPLYISVRNQNVSINIQTKPFVNGGHK